MSAAEIVLIVGGAERVVLSGQAGESVLDALRRSGAAAEAPCGGRGTCGKCRVAVVSGEVPAPDASERALLGEAALASGLRLACRLPLRGPLVLRLAGASGGARIREDWVPPADGLGAYESAPRQSRGFGLAVDLGTTTIAAYLVDFAPSGGGKARTVASASVLNSQRPYGADVIARIDHTIKHPGGLAELASLVRRDIADLASRLLSGAGADAAELLEVSVVGNTTMLHIFAGVDPRTIAAAPFAPVFLEAREGPAEDYGLPFPNARAILGPSVAGYVGADLVAAARAVGLERRSSPALVLDLGTNGEMALGDASGVWACATAAGPAFEGACISRGVGGVAGAVDSLRWTAPGALAYSTLGGLPAIGICGSGIVDAAACLARGSVVDDTGLLGDEWADEGYPLVASGADGAPLLFTQADLRQVQLAKAAVAAGIDSLLRERGLDYAGVGAVYLAGGFGSFLDPASAAAIGLIPPELLPKVQAVGNAAGAGAVRLLLRADELEAAAALAKKTAYLELSGSAFFNERYVDCMFFPAPDAVPAAGAPAAGTRA